MNVLIDCESSGANRRAFQKRGHLVFSCDLLPADDGETRYHIQADAIAVATEPWRFPQIPTVHPNRPWWDLMIAHPPCTYMTNAGVRHLHERIVSRLGNRTAVYGKDRWVALVKAMEFFNALKNAPIHRRSVSKIPYRINMPEMVSLRQLA